MSPAASSRRRVGHISDNDFKAIGIGKVYFSAGYFARRVYLYTTKTSKTIQNALPKDRKLYRKTSLFLLISLNIANQPCFENL